MRFSKRAVQRILDECLALTREGDTIALLGMPSVFRAAEDCSCQRSVFLLDANAAAIDRLAASPRGPCVIHCDLGSDLLPDVRASVVALDAPWYPDSTSAFLRAASQICVAGGHVLASIPPVGTRPGIEREWQGILREAERSGLKLLRLDPLAIPYLSPPFERNALRAEGITGFPPEWRRGTLAVFSSGKGEVPSPSTAILRPEPWHEIAVDGVRIRVRPGDRAAFADPTLVSLVPGDVLPSVSRRDPRRQMADVWTSGNRIFGCNGRATLAHILRAMARKEHAATVLCQALGHALSGEEQRLVAQVASQLDHLIRTEQDENHSYGY